MKKHIALVAHDACKKDLLNWVSGHLDKFQNCEFYATGTTGKMLSSVLGEVHTMKSGPLGGDQQLGAKIADGEIDYLIFFWDPMTSQPHDVDVKALLRLSVLYNIPSASNKATADMLVTSPLFNNPDFEPEATDYSAYLNRHL
jgi:methylglyoxal synthase